MQFDEIKQIVSLMKENEISFFRLETGDDKIELKRGLDMDAVKDLMKAVRVAPAAPAAPVYMPESEGRMVAPSGGLTPPMAEKTEAVPAGPTIDSPMVGTLYRSPGPDEGPFVSEGDRVTKDTVVCIIEAMKVMNEIKAEKAGVIKKALVEDGAPVQYGEALFELEA